MFPGVYENSALSSGQVPSMATPLVVSAHLRRQAAGRVVEECAVTRAVVAGLGDLEADREVFLTEAKARLGTP